ncbi:hypothetical protein RN001_010547 [Aquatica leii]|uniref:Odorant receptor n=1 Tax=Aquatica leii TaxID=1421715 RepID=A0AAN7S8M1_9COLE|nr:hypothetical protein RN001_010547 [Aquatica leii]
MTLKWVGLSLEDQSFLYQIYSTIVITVILLLYPLILIVSLFTDEFNRAIDTWVTVIGYLMVLPIAFTSFFARKQLLALFNKLTENSNHVLVQKWQRRKYIKTMVFLIFVVGSVGSQIVSSFTFRFTRANPNDWKLGFGAITFINITYSPNFEIVYFYQSVSILYGCILNIMNTIINLKSIMSDYKNTLQKNLINFVEYHVRVMAIAKDFQAIYTHSVFIIFLATISVTCIEIYRLSMLPLNDIGTLRLFFELITECFQMFFICTAGENMTHESERIAVVAYETDFMSTTLSVQKSLIIIMRQAQRSLLFRAGSIVDISVITFATILRTSYSAYAMLKKVNDNGA